MSVMDAHEGAEDVHGFPLEKRAVEPEARNLYWPLTMDAPTLVTTFTKPTDVILARTVAPTTTSTGSVGSSTCAPGDNTGICQKPTTSSSMTVPIVLGIT
jgi:hypothetical protein